MVSEFCTCGAQLPENARFCHRCGKPQREEPEWAALEQALAPAPAPAPEPEPVLDASPAAAAPMPGVSFRNPAAVRAALISSALAILAGLIPFPGMFHLLWQLLSIAAGGFASVYLYQRRTGHLLSVRAGLQLGWMTGLFCFVVMMVMITLLLAMLSSMGESGLRQLSIESGRPEIAEGFSMLLTNPAMLVFVLLLTFFFMTLAGSAGGALGSQVLDRE